MCCRLVLGCTPPPPDVLSKLLLLAGLEPSGEHTVFWTRKLEAEETTVRVRVLPGEGLEFSLYPSVTTWVGHADKRLAASLMFQAAALMGERLGGTLKQVANVQGCTEGGSEHVIAHYPERVIQWDAICPGFREVLTGA